MIGTLIYLKINKIMPFPRNATYPMIAAVLTLIAACASKPNHMQPPSSVATDNVQGDLTHASTPLPPNATPQTPTFAFQPRPAQSATQVMASYRVFDSTLKTTKSGDDFAPAQFLAQQKDGAMAESIRNEWLKSLGQRNQAALFQQQYAQLAPAGRHQETRCYAQLFGIDKPDQLISDLLNSTKISSGCGTLLQSYATQNRLPEAAAWRLVRILMAGNQVSQARALASALDRGTGQSAQEMQLLDIISASAQKKPEAAAARLSSNSAFFRPEQIGFAWGILGTAQARNHNMSAALSHFRQADRGQLTHDGFEWYARAALRMGAWSELANVIESMPTTLRTRPTWLYWLGRSYAATGQANKAQPLYAQAAQSGRNFYALMATEALGRRVNVQNNVADAPNTHVNLIAQDGAIGRALTLFQSSGNDWNMRRQAQAEWRYATRHMNEATLLAAAQLAFNHQFYEMAINSADNTEQLLNYRLRYIMPFGQWVIPYAQQAGVDPAWVYGLIRQESRFMVGAQSGVGAHGLMQVMPSTAQMIAKKIGMPSSELYTMSGNIRMGTWYMANTRNSLMNNEVLATAGYNAGPGRARKWQANRALEGAIYAETIPFTETRDYVKKVMTNAVYYAALRNEPKTSILQRMGSVPARY